MMKIRPLDDRLVVKPLELPEGLIKIPDCAKTGPPMRGEVVAVGPGKLVEGESGAFYRRAPEVKRGDIVQFGQYSVDVQYNGLCLIREGDVLVVEN